MIDLSEINATDLFDEVLSVDRKTHFFKDLRKNYSNKVKTAIIASGIKQVEITDCLILK
jgi:Asp-tRNA(Asn)/Glu-tRNA(Gln) amidotransferase B subunit